MDILPPAPKPSPRAPRDGSSRWYVVALLVASLVATVVLGALGVLDQDNTARLALGALALIAMEVRRTGAPPAPGGDASALVATAVASELGGMLGHLLPGGVL